MLHQSTILVVENDDIAFLIFERQLNSRSGEFILYRRRNAEETLALLETGFLPTFLVIEPAQMLADGKMFFMQLEKKGYFITIKICLLTVLIPLLVQEMYGSFPFYRVMTKPFPAAKSTFL